MWVLDCPGTWRPERSGSRNWFWCLSCSNERPCFCLQLAPWVRDGEHSTEWTQELGFYIDPVPMHCGFCSRALGSCVADVFLSLAMLSLSLKRLLKRLFMRRGGGGAGVYLKVLPCIAFSYGWTLKAFFSSCSSHALVWETYAIKERWEQPNCPQLCLWGTWEVWSICRS